MRVLTAKTAVDRLAARRSVAQVARDAIRDVNALDDSDDPPAMNIVVLSRDGRYASATNRAGRQFAVMTAGMDSAEVLPRAVVTAPRRRPRSSASPRSGR
jgi:isoaspartyl peptidase/L-asparaginase-like protein (Ntn-hydrolase superfamily)